MDITVLQCNISVETHYRTKTWVSSDTCTDGGFYRRAKKKYKIPQLRVAFRAKVDIPLQVNAIYHGAGNRFRAISNDEIVNFHSILGYFEVPDSLTLIGTMYSETAKDLKDDERR